MYEALGWPAGPEHEARDLAAWFNDWNGDGRRTAYPAFQALCEIASNRVREGGSFDDDMGGIPLHKPVEVPWWVVAVLSVCWMKYEHPEGEKQPMGKAFGLEGTKRGEHREVSKRRTRRRRRGLATTVAGEIAKDKTADAAVADVAEQWSASSHLVEKARKEYPEAVAKVVRELKAKDHLK
ncbi:MAG: hypothetical protein ACREB6_06450 [Rhodospirillales bacterium]